MTTKDSSDIKEQYTVYILRCADGSLYTGIAKDMKKRLHAHESGTASKYTRVRLPVVLVYTEKARDRSVASKRECEIKALSRSQKVAFIDTTSLEKNYL